MAQQGGKGKSSKRDQPTRKRYIAENRREINKLRRMAKQGEPNGGKKWQQVKAERYMKRHAR